MDKRHAIVRRALDFDIQNYKPMSLHINNDYHLTSLVLLSSFNLGNRWLLCCCNIVGTQIVDWLGSSLNSLQGPVPRTTDGMASTLYRGLLILSNGNMEGGYYVWGNSDW